MEATKKKMGRPVIGKPKTIEIKTRIDEDLEEKVKKADIVWTNEGSIEELEARVHQWLLENFRQK